MFNLALGKKKKKNLLKVFVQLDQSLTFFLDLCGFRGLHVAHNLLSINL